MEDYFEYDIDVVVDQKFSDYSTIVPWIEILETGIDSEDIRLNRYASKEPECFTECIFGGHRAYNEFKTNMVLPAKTLFRVWLHISTPQVLSSMKPRQTCSNFALHVRAFKMFGDDHAEEIAKNIHCEHTIKMPKSLNTDRYLGKLPDKNSRDKLLQSTKNSNMRQ